LSVRVLILNDVYKSAFIKSWISGIDDLKCFTTTIKAIRSCERASDKIWSGVFEPDEPISLDAM